jgi:recombination DNA repair RAD52 pathway protein
MNSGNKRTVLPYTEDEAQEIQERLDTKLDASHLSYRPAAQGTVAYLEGWKAFNLANEVFGFNGWSSEILSFTIDFVIIERNNSLNNLIYRLIYLFRLILMLTVKFH